MMEEFAEKSVVLSPYCEGPLKQQNLGDTGLYRWDDKHFRLHIQSGVLEVFSKNEETKEYETEPTLMSFSGAKHAKEWSISTPTIGSYGYDVVWDSGRIWSFLAADMASCRRWVDAINSSISQNPVDSTNHQGTESHVTIQGSVHTTERMSSTVKSAQHNISINKSRDLETTRLETHTPGGHGPCNENQATEEKFRAARHPPPPPPQQELVHDRDRKHDHVDALEREGHSDKFDKRDNDDRSGDSLNISAIPLVPSSDGSPESSPEVATTDQHTTTSRARASTVKPFRMNTVEFEELRENRAKHVHNPQTQQEPYFSSVEDELLASKNEIKQLQRQKHHLENQNEELQFNIDAARHQLNEAKEDSSRRCSDLEWQLAQAREVQAKASATHAHEIEQALLRAQVESLGSYETSSRALKEQNRREVSCLQDELVDERKRHANILLQEKKLRAQADTRESELRIKFSSLSEKHTALEKQFEQSSAEFRAAQMSWERERMEIDRAHEARVQKIIEEKDNLVFDAQESARKKVDGMNINFSKSLKDMEGSVQDGCRQAFQNEKMMALAAMEKRYNTEIEKVRAAERKKAEVEMNRLRDSFVRREQETMDDLQSLEQLHQEHYDRLQKEVKMYQKIISDNEMSWEDAKTESARTEEMKRRQTEEHLKTVHQHVKRAEKLEYELRQAHAEVQQARAEESKYREQLARAIEESKIQRAEYISMQRQCENDAAVANSWRTASQESEISLASYDTSLKIAREELMMVERNYARVQDENRRLKDALQYADHVVYGQAQQNAINSLQLENRMGADNVPNKKRGGGGGGKKAGGSRSNWVPTYI